MIGADALVPPKTSQPLDPWYRVVSYTETPVCGSATADTSASALPEHWVAAVCRRRGDGDTGVVVGRRLRRVRAAVAVADCRDALRGRVVDCGAEVRERVRARLDEQDLAVGTRGRPS